MLKAKSSSPLANVKLSFFKSIKFWGLFAFLIILAGLPVALFEVQQQQTINQHASTGNYPNMDVCGNLISISPVTESPSCPTSISSTTFSKYATQATVQNKGAATITVTFTWEKYWCNYIAKSSNGSLLHVCGGPDDPNPNGTLHTQQTKTVTLKPGDSVVLESGINQSTQACGTFQNDLTFSYTLNGRQCGPGNPATGVRFQTMNWGYCETANTTCVVPPTSTPTPTLTPTGLPTDTPTPTPLPSDTPTPTIPDTPTVTPTGTLTPTLSPTATPTGAPTDTPVPPGSPTPTIIVVKPTLPPTGPSNTIVAVGLVGVAISVLGLALLIGV